MIGIGETIRLSRLFADGKNAVVIAVDHGLYFGPIKGLFNLPEALVKLRTADGILLSAGMVGHSQDFFSRRGTPAMILRLNWATNYVAPWDYDHSHSVRLLHVAEAARLGADVVVGSLTLKAPDQAEDAQNVELFAGFVQEKFLSGIPLCVRLIRLGVTMHLQRIRRIRLPWAVVWLLNLVRIWSRPSSRVRISKKSSRRLRQSRYWR